MPSLQKALCGVSAVSHRPVGQGSVPSPDKNHQFTNMPVLISLFLSLVSLIFSDILYRYARCMHHICTASVK